MAIDRRHPLGAAVVDAAAAVAGTGGAGFRPKWSRGLGLAEVWRCQPPTAPSWPSPALLAPVG